MSSANNKKIIAIILLISIVSGTVLLNPKPARAIIPVTDIIQKIKEFVLDTAVKLIARSFIRQLTSDISQWARGGFSDENKPFAITNWTEYFKEAINLASAKFVEEFNLTQYCLPFKDVLGIRLGLGAMNMYLPSYQYYATCTIEDIVENAVEFWENPSISIYGWGAWTALSRPQNNIYGSFLLGAERRAELESEEKEKKDKEATVSGGYKNFSECIEENTAGVCLREELKTAGSEIHEALKTTIWSEFEWIIGADEISELLGAFITGITGKLISGFYNEQYYDYLSGIQKEFGYGTEQYGLHQQSLRDRQIAAEEIKAQTSENIKLLAESINQPEVEFQISMTEITKILLNLFEERTIELYTLIEGIDLKTDFIILEPDQTINDVPFTQYPLRCASFNKKCSQFNSGLPEVTPNCQSCLSQINKQINTCKEGCDILNDSCLAGCTIDKAINKTVKLGNCLSSSSAYGCLNQNQLAKKAEDACNNCVKRCGDLEFEQKNTCLDQFCKFEDLNLEGQELYGKCQIQKTKQACQVCLKEYFMPADYPLQIAEWISQEIVKYPILAKGNICIGSPVKTINACQQVSSSDIAFPNSNQFLLRLSLVCRTFPDSPRCQTYCRNLPSPSDSDCQGPNEIMLPYAISPTRNVDPNCLNCIDPLYSLTSAAIENYSKFCEILSLDDALCGR